MNKNTPLLLIILVLVFTGCKTQEEIRREKMVDDLANQMNTRQNIDLKTSGKLQEIESQLQKLTGKIEEAEHRLSNKSDEEQNSVKEQMKLLTEENASLKESQEKINERLTQVEDYLRKVLRALGKKGPKKKKSPYWQAISLYQKKQYKKAAPIFLSLLQNKKIKGKQRARMNHHMGMIRYRQKKYDKALIYFGRLFTEHPKASYNHTGLYYLGHSFKNLKQNDEAIQSFNEFLNRYPKSKYAKNAKATLKKLEQ